MFSSSIWRMHGIMLTFNNIHPVIQISKYVINSTPFIFLISLESKKVIITLILDMKNGDTEKITGTLKLQVK